MKFDTSKTLIGDLADENEVDTKEEWIELELIKAETAKKKKDESFDVGSVFWDETLDEDYTPPKSKVNENTLLIIIIVAIVITISVFGYLFMK